MAKKIGCGGFEIDNTTLKQDANGVLSANGEGLTLADDEVITAYTIEGVECSATWGVKADAMLVDAPIVLKSPNDTAYAVTVNNSGELVVSAYTT